MSPQSACEILYRYCVRIRAQRMLIRAGLIDEIIESDKMRTHLHDELLLALGKDRTDTAFDQELALMIEELVND